MAGNYPRVDHENVSLGKRSLDLFSLHLKLNKISLIYILRGKDNRLFVI